MSKMPSSPKYSWQQGNDFTIKQGGWSSEKKEKPFMIRWKSGKKVDPKLIMVLEHFRELYQEREEFFMKIFPGHHDEFADVFNKVGAVVLSRKKAHRRAKVGTIQRSLSLGSSAGSSRDIDESELVNQRFKVRTPVVVVGAVSGQSGSSSQGGTTSKGSK